MTDQQTDPEVIAVVRASIGRRILGLSALGILGVILIYVAFARSPSLPFQVFLLVIGSGSLWGADAMRRATASAVVLTETALMDADGTIIARIEDIQNIDRGFFAFKPSNGFLMRVATKSSNHMRPGLWWRVGRFVGVGGMTARHQSKVMSEALAVMVARRDGEIEGP